jgi:hypothetical protein
MGPKYDIGQRVLIRPVANEPLLQRESDVESYAGQVGEVSEYYWISPRTSDIFFIYKVRVGNNFQEVVLYEDELEPCLS